MKRQMLSVIAYVIVSLIGMLVSPYNAAARPVVPDERIVFLETISVESVDLGAPGASVGDLRAVRGVVRATQNGEIIGSYASSQTLVGPGLEGGNEERSVVMEISIGRSDVTMVSMVVLPAVGPPSSRLVVPIVGGTGKFLGATGSLTIFPLSATQYRAVLKFV